MLEDIGIQVLILIVSIIGLASSSHFAIKSVEAIIELTGLRDVSAGFIILAVLTSTPEIVVAIIAVTQGNSSISIGDILGSNIFNIGAILGLLGMFGYLKLCCNDLIMELADTLSIIVLIPLILIVNQYTLYKIPNQLIGLILLSAFFINVYLITKKKLPDSKQVCATEDNCEIKKEDKLTLNQGFEKKTATKTPKIIIIGTLLASFALIVLFAQLTVSSASNIAIAFGVPAILVGAKLVAIGTSLPELTLDIAAVRRGRVQLAIGDIIGSNLTNLTLVLGIILLFSPFQVDMNIFIEIIPFLLITSILFWRFVMLGGISRIEGAILMLSYIVFLILVA